MSPIYTAKREQHILYFSSTVSYSSACSSAAMKWKESCSFKAGTTSEWEWSFPWMDGDGKAAWKEGPASSGVLASASKPSATLKPSNPDFGFLKSATQADRSYSLAASSWSVLSESYPKVGIIDRKSSPSGKQGGCILCPSGLAPLQGNSAKCRRR